MFFTWFEKHIDNTWWAHDNSTFSSPEEAEQDFMNRFKNVPSREYKIFPHIYPKDLKVIWTKDFISFHQNGSIVSFLLN